MTATTIEQSKRLLDAGIDPLTADMYYLKDIESNDFTLFNGKSTAVRRNLFSYRKGYTIPAWSLSALFELMQNGGCSISVLYFPFTRWTVSFIDIDSFKDTFSDTLIDAVAEMVGWLFERGFLKKEENTNKVQGHLGAEILKNKKEELQ